MIVRGTTDGAICSECPFSNAGMPSNPVVGEGPEDPAWIIIGEGPGFQETRHGRPFIGASGEVVNKILAKIGRPRSDLWVTNATCCQPPQGSPEIDRQRAATCCGSRLMNELAQFPGKPILTLGAVAARATIPKAALDAIDPPDTPKAIKKSQKLRQQPTLKAELDREKAIKKLAEKRLAQKIRHYRSSLVKEYKTKYRKKAEASHLDHEIARVQGKFEVDSKAEAIREYELKIKERELEKLVKAKEPKKPKKPKPIKITDICGTLFDIDVDGSGVRPLVPAIHPAALLRGGGASIGGSHTPDLAFINLIYDASKVDSLARGKDIRLKLNVDYELEDQGRAIELFLQTYRDALNEGACSIDLETYVDDPDRHTALMAYVAKIKVIGIATNERTISIAWDILPPWCFSLLQVLFGSVEIWAHNGLYDFSVLRAHGFIVKMGGDTLLAHHATFPGNSHKLQVVAGQFYGVGAWKSEFRNSSESSEKLAIYNAKDTGSTHALRAPLTKWLGRTDTQRVYDLDKKMSDIASQMHLAGMPVSREVNSELLATFSKNVKESRQQVEDIARDPKLREQIWHHLAVAQAGKKRNLDPDDLEERYKIRLAAMRLDPDWRWKISAGKHIAALLLAMGVGLYQTTEKGEITTKKDVLEGLVDVPVVREILAFRENDKLLSTFVWQLFDRKNAEGETITYGYADEHDRIHPIWNIHRITGRWASQWPVVSNVPKDKWKKLAGDDLLLLIGLNIPTYRKPNKGESNAHNEFTTPSGSLMRVNSDNSFSKQIRPNLRRQIQAPPGRIFVGFDFGQIEARVIALISGDPFLCAIFAEGRDPHIECARIIWPNFDKLDPDTRKQLRENVKSVEYGYFYMAQLETLHRTMLKAGNIIKLADLAKAIQVLAKAMPGIAKWQQASIAKAMSPPHEIKDFVLGRRRTWPMGQVEGTEAVNFGVQSAAAAIMNRGMASMWDALRGYKQAFPIAQIHDAAVFECWAEDADRLAVDVAKHFTQEYGRDGRSIPFPVDVKIGASWDLV